MVLIKTAKEIKTIKEAGFILARIMRELENLAEPGATTEYLNRAAEALILKYGAQPAFKGYEGFPATLCTSVNTQVVHAVPSDYRLKPGDLLSLDLGLKHKGFYADMAVSKIVGADCLAEPDFEASRLIKVCRKALKLAVKKARPGNTFGDVGNTIQRFVEGQGFQVVRDLCGHGIGRKLHEEPKILNYGKRRTGETIKAGMVFCLEPMITAGDWRLKKGKDGFSFETRDGSLSAHFEHTIAVLEKGAEILTKI